METSCGYGYEAGFVTEVEVKQNKNRDQYWFQPHPGFQ